jgi:putative colanic acid biosynthesis UDP-glucose lipid carrier transferase
VGSTKAAEEFIDAVKKYYYYGYKCIGFLDDEKSKLNGCTYLGTISDLNTILAESKVDEVIIALPNAQHEQISACIEACDFHGKRVRMIPDLYLYASSNISINTIGLLPVINFRSLPQDRWGNKMLKRLFDV